MEPHANYEGGSNEDLLVGEANSQPSALACSQSYQRNRSCAVFVYCPNPAGCGSMHGKTDAYQAMLRPPPAYKLCEG